MQDFIQQAFSGLATGGIYAIVALALVMIYQTTHHVNFAQGEMAMFCTYLAWALIAYRTGCASCSRPAGRPASASCSASSWSAS